MQNIMVNKRQLLPDILAGYLPPFILSALQTVIPEGQMPEELRLRRDRCASVTVAGKNYRLPVILDGASMEHLFFGMCEGSVYAHGETVREGYLILPGGIRVGICGRAVLSQGSVTGVTDLTAFSIRIPHPTPPVGGEICDLLRLFSLTSGVLIYAPPGVGKTTLLRNVAAGLAGGENPLRVVAVDTRGELEYGLRAPNLLLDVLSGYPRGLGISVAARTLAAQVIVCDEIGDMQEAQEIVQAHSGGVPLLASAHGAGIRELLARPGLRLLHEARCFGAYVGISRRPDVFGFLYDIVLWEAADAML